jgi:hypothetical protein
LAERCFHRGADSSAALLSQRLVPIEIHVSVAAASVVLSP